MGIYVIKMRKWYPESHSASDMCYEYPMCYTNTLEDAEREAERLARTALTNDYGLEENLIVTDYYEGKSYEVTYTNEFGELVSEAYSIDSLFSAGSEDALEYINFVRKGV